MWQVKHIPINSKGLFSYTEKNYSINGSLNLYAGGYQITLYIGCDKKVYVKSFVAPKNCFIIKGDRSRHNIFDHIRIDRHDEIHLNGDIYQLIYTKPPAKKPAPKKVTNDLVQRIDALESKVDKLIKMLEDPCKN